jgi:CBS domain containing-hemolysin-like protein
MPSISLIICPPSHTVAGFVMLQLGRVPRVGEGL